MADDPGRPTLRLRGVLRLQLEQQDRRGYSRLAERIAEANPGHPKRALERRKLKKLVDGEDVPLTIDELIGLDEFLTQFGEGLSDKPLFERHSSIRSLVANGSVTIVLGAYSRTEHKRNDLSRWDVRSMIQLQGRIHQLGGSFDFEDVLTDEEEPGALPYLEAVGPSVASVGSPRACLATEIMLARMLGVDPFDKGVPQHMPVGFIWRPELVARSSSFSADPAELRSLDAELHNQVESGRARGVLRVGEDLYPDGSGSGETRWTSYGIVAVQQRASGCIWMVCAGLIGPATYASAVAAANELTGAVPEGRGAHSQIRWDVVECTVESQPLLHADNRVVLSQRVVAEGYWDHALAD